MSPIRALARRCWACMAPRLAVQANNCYLNIVLLPRAARILWCPPFLGSPAASDLLYGEGDCGGALVIESSGGALARVAVLAALVAALGLAGCGRKGGLDLPPSAAVSDPGPAGDPKQASAVGPDGKPV